MGGIARIVAPVNASPSPRPPTTVNFLLTGQPSLRLSRVAQAVVRNWLDPDDGEEAIITGLSAALAGQMTGHRLAYSANPCQSMTTHGSSPTVHAACPGAMIAKSPGPYSISSPSSITTFIRPDTK